MVFGSAVFLFVFLPAVYLLYLLMPWDRAQNALLLAASVFFYAWGESGYVLLLFCSALFNWGAGLWIYSHPRKRKAILAVAAAGNLSILAFFKYAGLLLKTCSFISGIQADILQPHLPIGISFFTFQALSYVIDVSKNPQIVQKNFGKLFLYISLFPQLVAGPIVKYSDISPQLEHRELSVDGAAEGIRRFICGLAKKLLVADVMAKAADAVFADAALYHITACAWLGAFAYALQIYFDFSGYSDMAIGLGKMFGFHFKENFNYPYAACGIRDFWRRWHISLSAWFREYLYIPLGGNKNGQVRACFNVLVVFFFTGLWHGADYTFILWGLYHGILLVLERTGIIRILKGRLSFLSHIYTVAVVVIGFVIFRADNLSAAGQYLSAMFHLERMPEGAVYALPFCTPYFLFTLVLAVVAAMPVVPAIKRRLLAEKRKQRICFLINGFSYAASICLFVFCIMSIAADSYSPFIYFQF